MEENLLRQQEEIEVLNSIYEENIVLESESRVSIVVRAEEDGEAADLSVSMSPAYPGTSPPSYQLSAPFLTSEEKQEISNSFDQLYLENMGESIVFLWVEHLRSFLQNRPSKTSVNCKTTSHDTVFDDQLVADEILLSQALEKSRIDCKCPEIVTGEVIEDRKSVFQGHTAKVKSLDDVKMVISKLYDNKKIAGATHNMYAYRIFCPEKQTWLSDCEDDGEDAAGGRMLHLLDILDVTDRLVVVTRWYGGVKLGPDRFKLINNAARKVLMLADPSLSQEDLKTKKKKGK